MLIGLAVGGEFQERLCLVGGVFIWRDANPVVASASQAIHWAAKQAWTASSLCCPQRQTGN
jgi:hypothetical protein